MPKPINRKLINKPCKFFINGDNVEFQNIVELMQYIKEHECVSFKSDVQFQLFFTTEIDYPEMIDWFFDGVSPWEADYWNTHYKRFPIRVGSFAAERK